MRSPDYGQVRADILAAAASYEGIPTPENLSMEGGGSVRYSAAVIRRCAREDPSVKDLLEEKGAAYVRACSREAFDEAMTALRWGFARGKVRAAIEERLDTHILEAIGQFKGVPNPFTLTKAGGGPLPYAQSTVFSRLDFNSALQAAIEAKAPSNPLAERADALPAKPVSIRQARREAAKEHVTAIVQRLRRA